jgi:hypothetical protein
MSTETLNAGTQYNDWQGQIALDDQDFKGIREYLENNLDSNDKVIGIDTFFHGESLNRNEEIEVKIYVTNEKLEGKYRAIKFEIKLEEFFKLFKRINITASRKNELEGKTIEVIELN